MIIQINQENNPIHWKFEGSPDSNPETSPWVILYEEVKKSQNFGKYQTYNTQLFSSFRFTMIGRNSINTDELFLEKFDFFGYFVDPLNSMTVLRRLYSNLKLSVAPSTNIYFQFLTKVIWDYLIFFPLLQ